MNFLWYLIMLFVLVLFGQLIIHLTVIKWLNIPKYSQDDKKRVEWFSYKYILILSSWMVICFSLITFLASSDVPNYFWACMMFCMPLIWKFGVIVLMIILRHNVFNDEVGNEPVDFYNSSGFVYVSYTELLLQYEEFTLIPLILQNFIIASPPFWNIPLIMKEILIINYIFINFPIIIPDKLSKWSGHDLRGEGIYIYGLMLLIGEFEPVLMFFAVIFIFA